MNAYVSLFLQGLVLVPVTLLPIVNPLSSAPVFAATVGTNRSNAKRLARQVALNAWFVLVASMLIGSYVLALFGISLPVVRIGGGLRCRMPRSSSAASSRSRSRSRPGRARSRPRSPPARRFPATPPCTRSACWSPRAGRRWCRSRST